MKVSRKFLVGALCSVLCATCSLAAPDPPKCKGSPKLVGGCYQVHGRIQAGNGTPMIRIWKVGTKRMLGVPYGEEDGDPEIASLPETIINTDIRDQNVFGDFVVCPLTKERPGAMQMVCVESATHLVLSPFEPQKKKE
jgi:hypothetical protein